MSVVVGDPALTLAMCDAALGRGLFAQAIVPPVIPSLGSRLRLDRDGIPPRRGAPGRRTRPRPGRAQAGFDPRATAVLDHELEVDARDDRDERGGQYEREAPEPASAGPFDYERIARAA